MMFIPVLIITFITYSSFKSIIVNKTYNTYYDIVTQTGRNIEYKLDSFNSYVKFIMSSLLQGTILLLH